MLLLCSELLLRSAVILLLAGSLCAIPKFLTAAQRHRVWACAFGLLLLWPVLAFTIPEVQVAWPRVLGASGAGRVTVEQSNFTPVGASISLSGAWWWAAIWLAGAVISFAPALLGLARIHRLVRRSVPEALGEAGCPEVRLQLGAAMPLTCGVFRSRILLPVSSNDWPAGMRRSVLLHELAHARRRDVAVQLAARLVAGLWWFQPLVWLALRQLRAESERACDAAVVRSGVRSSDYAADLLEAAHRFSGYAPASPAAIGMLRGGNVNARIETVLNETILAAHPARAMAALVILAVSAASAAAVSVTAPDSTQPLGGILPMKRALLVTLTGLTVTTISLNASPAATPASPGAQQTNNTERRVIRVGSQVLQSNLVHQVAPVYPAAAKSAGVEGTVVLKITVTKEGVPEDLQVLSSPDDELSQSAVEAVTQWRYRPTLLNGQPVDVSGEVKVTYSLTK